MPWLQCSPGAFVIHLILAHLPFPFSDFWITKKYQFKKYHSFNSQNMMSHNNVIQYDSYCIILHPCHFIFPPCPILFGVVFTFNALFVGVFSGSWSFNFPGWLPTTSGLSNFLKSVIWWLWQQKFLPWRAWHKLILCQILILFPYPSFSLYFLC